MTERFPSTGSLSAYALGDELLRATFTEDGREGEGMFAASVVDFGSVPIAAGPPVGYQLPQADAGIIWRITSWRSQRPRTPSLSGRAF